MLLIRHGEAEGNLERRLIGQLDVRLSAEGRRQAHLLADAVWQRRIDRIVSSDLSRAVETVRPLARLLGCEIELEPRLREVHNGSWGGLLPDEVATRWPELWARYQGGEDVLRPDGESWAVVSDRVAAALDAIAATCDDEEVVAVGTHAGPILTTLYRAENDSRLGNVFAGRFGEIPNASVTTIRMPGPRVLEVGAVPWSGSAGG